MAEVEEEVAGLLEKHLPGNQETRIRVVHSTCPDDEHGDSVTQPLFQDGHTADAQTATDGADPGTSVPLELELAGGDGPVCSGSVRSLCSDSSRHECPICNEPLEPGGDHRLTQLHCDHALCHRCVANILRRAKCPGSVQCPFCRQTTPFPQLEIRRLQEESYSLFIQDTGPASPDVPASPSGSLVLERELEALAQTGVCGCCVYPSRLVRRLRLIWQQSLCFSISVVLLLLLLLGLLACFLYIDISLIMLSSLFND